MSAVANRLEQIRKRGGIKSREVAQILDTTPQTVSRWQTGKSQPRSGILERLLLLEYVLDRLSDFYPPGEARLWLFAPHRLLDGDSPAQRIRDGNEEAVLTIIDQLQSGAYV
jgi:transcriptional regulator with XRE-family HTH domain